MRDSMDPGTDCCVKVEVFYGHLVMVASFLLFTVINRGVKRLEVPMKMRERVWYWRNTTVSWLHACVVGTGVLYCILFKQEMFGDMVLFCDYFLYSLIAFSQGYFWFDLVDCTVNSKLFSNWEVVLHHIGVIYTMGYTLQYRLYLPYIIIALMIEINSVFLHGRKLLQFHQWPFSHWFYQLTVVLNLLTFAVCRIFAVVFLSVNIYQMWTRFSFVYSITITITIITMYPINFVLFWRLLRNDVLRNLSYKIKKTKKDEGRNGVSNGVDRNKVNVG